MEAQCSWEEMDSGESVQDTSQQTELAWINPLSLLRSFFLEQH